MSAGNDRVRIGLLGAGGRMGRMLIAALAADPGLQLCAAVDAPGTPDVGRDVGELAGLGKNGVALSAVAAEAFAACDVLIDFTRPSATLSHARLAAQAGKALVIGTTGLSESDKAEIAAASKSAPILLAANMSLGVTLLSALVEAAAQRLGDDFDIEVLEMHHRAKVDAPSGTALALGEAAARGRAVALTEKATRVRDGITGPRVPGTIGFATLRGGDVVGDHTVIFAGPGERLELTHKASSRQLFAQGALRAARWLAGQPVGLYSMRDVLGI